MVLIADSADALVFGIVTTEIVAACFGVFAGDLTNWLVQSSASVAAFADVLGYTPIFTATCNPTCGGQNETSVFSEQLPPYPASRCDIGWRAPGSGTAVPQLLDRRYSI